MRLLFIPSPASSAKPRRRSGPVAKEKPENPFLGALADAEGERDDARRHSQDLRVLLDRVLREVDDLPEELRSAIEEALR